jgi:membrane protease YdiL (CAAX protease family)
MDLPDETAPPASTDGAVAVSASPKRPGVWSGLGTVVLYFLLQFGLSILIGTGIALALAVKVIFAGPHHRQVDAKALVHSVLATPNTQVVLAVLTIVAAAAVMAVIVHRTWAAQWSAADLPGFGFVQPKNKLSYLGAILLGLATLVVGGAMTHLLAHGNPVHQDVGVMAGKVPLGMRVLLAALVVGVAPCVEELVFRGVLLSGLASRMRIGWAALVSAIIFGCVHLPDFKFAWYPVPALILLGLVLAWLRIRTRSLWPSITLHATNNFLAVLAWFLVAHPR